MTRRIKLCATRKWWTTAACVLCVAVVASSSLRSDEPFAADPAWTPPPREGNVPAWQKMTDKDWIDGRFRQMDTGPFLNATFQYRHGDKMETVYRGTAIRIGDKGEATVLFDRNQLRMCCGWMGWLHHKDTRFGLLNTPSPGAPIAFQTAIGLGWASNQRELESGGSAKTPISTTLPRWGNAFSGILTDGKRVSVAYRHRSMLVTEDPWFRKLSGKPVFERRMIVAGEINDALNCALSDSGKPWKVYISNQYTGIATNGERCVAAVSAKEPISLREEGPCLWLDLPKVRDPTKLPGHAVTVLYWTGLPSDLTAQLQAYRDPEGFENGIGGWGQRNAQWPKPLVTRGVLGDDSGPLAVDTLTVPFDNPHHGLMFCSGLDFLPDGRIAVCTAHGDVWLVKADSRLERVEWKRFATGLYQPLGLRVVDGDIYVLERGQITRLKSRTNGTDEAWCYENVCDRWYLGGGEHSFDTRLETDPQGNYYFFKTGDTDTPTGGCLMKVSKDGSKCEIFATGFRHPIGMGMSPTGVLTGADQQGNWMPASKIDEYKQGGFYGDMRAHHRAVPPKIFDPPLMWIPHEIDNSTGGQVWVPEGKWGPLGGRMLHFSWGQCKMFLTHRQVVDGLPQGGLSDLGVSFESGPIGGRFSPNDGHLYVTGLTGWQTAAAKDGCLQRVRYTGKPFVMPLGISAHANGIKIDFSQPVDPKLATDIARYRIAIWGYRWSGDYGSKRYSTIDPTRLGEDPLLVTKASVLPDGKSVFLEIPGIRPTMQMQVEYLLATATGKPLKGQLYNTIHKLAPALATP